MAGAAIARSLRKSPFRAIDGMAGSAFLSRRPSGCDAGGVRHLSPASLQAEIREWDREWEEDRARAARMFCRDEACLRVEALRKARAPGLWRGRTGRDRLHPPRYPEQSAGSDKMDRRTKTSQAPSTWPDSYVGNVTPSMRQPCLGTRLERRSGSAEGVMRLFSAELQGPPV